MEEQNDIAPDKIVPKKWSEAAALGEALYPKGGGFTPRKALQSPGFKSGTAGWRIDTNGDAEFNNGTFRGTFAIGGRTITIGPTDDIQTAIDALPADGGTVALAAGTYNVTSNITIPSSVTLAGAGYGTVIDFGGNAIQMKAVGSDVYATGTVAVNNDSTTVTGTGTTWTTAMEGRQILIGEFWYTIDTVGSTTSITLATPFLSSNVSGASYVIASTVSSVAIKTMTLQNSSVALLKIQYVNGATLDQVLFYDGAVGIDGDDSSFISLLSCTCDTCTEGMNFNNFHYGTYWNGNIVNSTNNGFTANNISNWGFEIFCIPNSGGDGMNFTSVSNCGIEDFAILNSGGQGIEFVATSSGVTISDGSVDASGSDGIKLTATTDNIHLTELHLTNNGGYGINIAASTCDDNILVAVYAANNSSGSLSDSGTGTLKSTTVNIIP